jgi:hypothetical protein
LLTGWNEFKAGHCNEIPYIPHAKSYEVEIGLAARLPGKRDSPVIKDSPGDKVTLDLAADDSSDSNVPVSEFKMAARPDVRKKAPPAAAAAAASSTSYAAMKPSVLSQFDSSDSESSLRAWKQTLQASRQPKMMEYNSSDDDDDDDDDDSSLDRKPKSKMSSTAAASKKTVSRKKAPPIDKERKLQEKQEKEPT